MNRYEDLYKARCCTIDDILAMIRDDDIIVTSGEFSEPALFYNNYHKIAALRNNVTIFKGKKGNKACAAAALTQALSLNFVPVNYLVEEASDEQ